MKKIVNEEFCIGDIEYDMLNVVFGGIILKCLSSWLK